MNDKATLIVDGVLNDIRGRKGIGDELAAIEPDIYEEMRGGLIQIVREHLESEE